MQTTRVEIQQCFGTEKEIASSLKKLAKHIETNLTGIYEHFTNVYQDDFTTAIISHK